MLGLDGIVGGQTQSKRTSSDGLRDPTFSPKARLEQRGHSTLRSLASTSEQAQGIGNPSILVPLSWSILAGAETAFLQTNQISAVRARDC